MEEGGEEAPEEEVDKRKERSPPLHGLVSFCDGGSAIAFKKKFQ